MKAQRCLARYHLSSQRPSKPTLAPRSCARRPVHARKTPPKRLYNIIHAINEAYNSSFQTIYYTRIYSLIGSISYDKRAAGHKTAALALACLVFFWEIRVFSTSARRNRRMIGHLGKSWGTRARRVRRRLGFGLNRR